MSAIESTLRRYVPTYRSAGSYFRRRNHRRLGSSGVRVADRPAIREDQQRLSGTKPALTVGEAAVPTASALAGRARREDAFHAHFLLVLPDRCRAFAPRHVLMLPDFDRADRIGEFYGNPKTRTFAELLIDAEEDPYLQAVLVGMLREGRQGSSRALGAPRTRAA